MGFCFGAFEVDTQVFELRESGAPVRIDRKVFDLLCYLCEHRDRVVDKAELLDHVWAGDTVVEAVVPTAITRLRRTLRQESHASGPIQTVHGRGYRFVGEAIETQVFSSPPGTLRTISTPQPAAPEPKREHAQRVGMPFDTDVRPNLRDPFVGRAAIMERLIATLDKALSGVLRGRLLVGEPGIGKTRVTTELSQLARKRGARIWSGRCPPTKSPPVLWPWQQIARQGSGARELSALRALGLAQRDALAFLIPELASERTTQHDRTQPPVGKARLELFDAVSAWLRLSATQGPIVLVLDDLHWADLTSLELLEHVLLELGDSPILILGTYRDAELAKGHPHAALLDRCERVPAWKRIALQSFAIDDVSQYLREVTGADVPHALASHIHERTGGNPFFVRETVRTLSERTLSAARSSYSEVELPAPARDVIRRRVAALPELSQHALEGASVLGTEIEIGLLAMLLERSTNEVLDAVDRALAAQLLMVEGLHRYAFSHVLIRDTVYGDLASRTRRELHLRAARLLHERDAEQHRQQVSAHLASAGEEPSFDERA